MIGLFFKILAFAGLIGGPVISGSIYIWNAFWAMSYLVGTGWAFVWTFPMPLGIGTFPFWAREIYNWSDPDIWFWYTATFAGLGLGFVSVMIAIARGEEF